MKSQLTSICKNFHKHRARITELKEDIDNSLKIIHDYDRMELESYSNWGEFKVALTSNLPFLKPDIIYDEYTKGNITFYLEYNINYVGSLETLTKNLYCIKYVDPLSPIFKTLTILNRSHTILIKEKIKRIEKRKKFNIEINNETKINLSNSSKAKMKKRMITSSSVKSLKEIRIPTSNESKHNNINENEKSKVKARPFTRMQSPIDIRRRIFTPTKILKPVQLTAYHPVLKISIIPSNINSNHTVHKKPIYPTEKIKRGPMYKKLARLQIIHPNFRSIEFAIKDLVIKNIKLLGKENDSNYECLERIKIYKILNNHIVYLKRLFFCYNLYYLSNFVRLEFSPELLYLDKLSTMNYEVFRKICSDLGIFSDSSVLIRIYYLSCKPSKEIPSNLN